MSEVIQVDSFALEELRDSIEQALSSKDKITLLRLIQSEFPADVAHTLDNMPVEQVAEVFKTLLLGDVPVCAEVLVELEPVTIDHLFEELSIQEWAWIFTELSDDDTLWILDLFPAEAQSQIMARMSREDKEEVLQLRLYPEESAGRLMTFEFVAMDVGATVEAAVERVRSTRDFDPTNLFFLYVTDNEKLVGMVSLRQLLLSKKAELLRDIMRRDVSAVSADMDQEEVAQLFRRYDEVTVPVVDDEGHILGIITVDDVMDVLEEESDEDLYKIIGSSDEELLAGKRTIRIVWLRLPWIFAAFCGSLLVSQILQLTEGDVFINAAQIFAYVPLICAMGGNVGVQSSTVMARFLSNNELNWTEARHSTFKEAKVGMTLGLICGVAVGLFAWFWESPAMTVTVVTAMISAMTTAATTGAIIPVVMKRFGVDPALATGPFVTSFNDVVATCVYLAIAFSLVR